MDGEGENDAGSGGKGLQGKELWAASDRRAAEHCTVESNAYPYGALTIDGSR